MVILATVIKGLVTAIITLMTIVAPWAMKGATAPYAPIDSENCLLNFAVISDIHVETTEDGETEAGYTDVTSQLVFSGIESYEGELDALVLAGDNTDHGYVAQWNRLEEILGSYNLADEIILASGNHDTWTRGDGDRTHKGLFIQYNRRIADRAVGNVYYSTEVNGYPFIVLCSESDNTGGYFSDTQIKWLKKELKKAAEKELPIFVVCHWPLNQTHGLPVTWGEDDYDDMTGGMGEQSARIEKLLKKYDNVFLLSGHIHAGLSNENMQGVTGYQTLESDGSLHSLNLPRVNAVQGVGNFMIGYGYNVEVYENEVVFRARNYMTDTWAPHYDYTVELV